MAATESATSVQRKMAAGRDDSHTAGRSVLRALRLGLARAARDALNLPVSVIGITQARMTQAALARHVDGDRLLMLLDGEAAGAGVLSADRSCLAALIQQQTMGQVTTADPGDRPFTATDAAMVAPLADAMLARAAELSEAAADRQALDGLRFGARVADVRAMQLALDAERFRVFDLTLDFAGGVRQGALCLALPIAEEVAGASAPPADPDRMARVAGAARAELRVVIGQLQLSLADLSGMRPGDVLPLVDPQISRAALIAIDGSRVSTARLGQAGGLRAVRLNEAAPAPVPAGFEPGLPGQGSDANPPVAAPPALSLEVPEAPVEEGGAPLPEPDAAGMAAEISELAGLPLAENDAAPAQPPDGG